MRIINAGTQNRRKLYASKVDLGDDKVEYTLSAMESTVAGRRPMARFDSQQELEQEANRRGCVIVWQTN